MCLISTELYITDILYDACQHIFRYILDVSDSITNLSELEVYIERRGRVQIF